MPAHLAIADGRCVVRKLRRGVLRSQRAGRVGLDWNPWKKVKSELHHVEREWEPGGTNFKEMLVYASSTPMSIKTVTSAQLAGHYHSLPILLYPRSVMVHLETRTRLLYFANHYVFFATLAVKENPSRKDAKVIKFAKGN